MYGAYGGSCELEDQPLRGSRMNVQTTQYQPTQTTHTMIPIWDQGNPHPKAVGVNFRINKILLVDDFTITLDVTEIIRWHENNPKKAMFMIDPTRGYLGCPTVPIAWARFESYNGYKPKVFYENADMSFGDNGFKLNQKSILFYKSGWNQGCFETWRKGYLRILDPVTSMQSFPFDYQDWKIVMKMEEDTVEYGRFFQNIVSCEHEDSMLLVCDTTAIPGWSICSVTGQGPCRKWENRPVVNLVCFTNNSSEQSLGTQRWEVRIVLKRGGWYYVANVWVFTIMFTCMAAGAVVLEEISERIMLIMSLLLLLAVLKVSFTNSFPNLSYFTVLELVLYCGFMQLATLLSTFVVLEVVDMNSELTDNVVFWIYLVLDIVINSFHVYRTRKLSTNNKKRIEIEMSKVNQNPNIHNHLSLHPVTDGSDIDDKPVKQRCFHQWPKAMQQEAARPRPAKQEQAAKRKVEEMAAPRSLSVSGGGKIALAPRGQSRGRLNASVPSGLNLPARIVGETIPEEVSTGSSSCGPATADKISVFSGSTSSGITDVAVVERKKGKKALSTTCIKYNFAGGQVANKSLEIPSEQLKKSVLKDAKSQ